MQQAAQDTLTAGLLIGLAGGVILGVLASSALSALIRFQEAILKFIVNVVTIACVFCIILLAFWGLIDLLSRAW